MGVVQMRSGLNGLFSSLKESGVQVQSHHFASIIEGCLIGDLFGSADRRLVEMISAGHHVPSDLVKRLTQQEVLRCDLRLPLAQIRSFYCSPCLKETLFFFNALLPHMVCQNTIFFESGEKADRILQMVKASPGHTSA